MINKWEQSVCGKELPLHIVIPGKSDSSMVCSSKLQECNCPPTDSRWFCWPAGVVMPSEEPVSLVFFMQIQCFVSGCQEVFAPEQVDPLDSKSKWLSSTSSFQGGTQLPLRAGVLLYGKLQTSHPIPCPQFRVPHAYPKSGRVTAEPSTGSSRWACLGNVFFLSPTTTTSWCCIAEVWHWLSQTRSFHWEDVCESC